MSGVVANTTFVDTGVRPGTTYHYRMAAVESDVDRSAPSPAAVATTLPMLGLDGTIETLLSSPPRSTGTMTLKARSEAGLNRVEVVVDNGSVVTQATAVGIVADPRFIDPTITRNEVTQDPTTLSDGEHEVAFRTVDADGRTTEGTRTVTVDNKLDRRPSKIRSFPTPTTVPAVGDPVCDHRRPRFRPLTVETRFGPTTTPS